MREEVRLLLRTLSAYCSSAYWSSVTLREMVPSEVILAGIVTIDAD